MGLIEQQQLAGQLSPPADATMAQMLVSEFVNIERRYIQCDWEPAELDAGQFCEILARILYHLDSGTVNHTKSVDECLTYVEDEKGQQMHTLLPRSTGLHFAKVIRCVYKFRSARGAVHITPTYSANHLDSRFMIECARWCMCELVRVLSSNKPSHEQAARTIRELLQFEVPAVGKYGDRLMVQRTDLSCQEEVLILLHFAGEQGMSRRDIGASVPYAAPRVSDALGALQSADARQVIQVNGRIRLTDLGCKRVREQLGDKLLVQ